MAMFAWTDPTMPTHDNFPSDFNAKHRLVCSEGLEPPRFYSLPPRASAIPPRAHGIPAQGSGRINGADVTNRPWGDKARRRLKSGVSGGFFVDLGMIRTRRAALAQSEDRFSEKIMLKQ
jgi:hypothetical protein